MFGSDNLDQEVVAQAQASSQKNTQWFIQWNQPHQTTCVGLYPIFLLSRGEACFGEDGIFGCSICRLGSGCSWKQHPWGFGPLLQSGNSPGSNDSCMLSYPMTIIPHISYMPCGRNATYVGVPHHMHHMVHGCILHLRLLLTNGQWLCSESR